MVMVMRMNDDDVVLNMENSWQRLPPVESLHSQNITNKMMMMTTMMIMMIFTILQIMRAMMK